MRRCPLVIEKGLYPKSIRIFCDEWLLKEFEQLEGVSQVFPKKAWGAYTLLVDPRYEQDEVIEMLMAWASLEAKAWKSQKM